MNKTALVSVGVFVAAVLIVGSVALVNQQRANNRLTASLQLVHAWKGETPAQRTVSYRNWKQTVVANGPMFTGSKSQAFAGIGDFVDECDAPCNVGDTPPDPVYLMDE